MHARVRAARRYQNESARVARPCTALRNMYESSSLNCLQEYIADGGLEARVPHREASFPRGHSPVSRRRSRPCARTGSRGVLKELERPSGTWNVCGLLRAHEPVSGETVEADARRTVSTMRTSRGERADRLGGLPW